MVQILVLAPCNSQKKMYAFLTQASARSLCFAFLFMSFHTIEIQNPHHGPRAPDRQTSGGTRNSRGISLASVWALISNHSCGIEYKASKLTHVFFASVLLISP